MVGGGLNRIGRRQGIGWESGKGGGDYWDGEQGGIGKRCLRRKEDGSEVLKGKGEMEKRSLRGRREMECRKDGEGRSERGGVGRGNIVGRY